MNAADHTPQRNGRDLEDARQDAADQARMQATLPPPGTPLTGGGGLLPGLKRSQVSPHTVITVVTTLLVIGAVLYLLSQLTQILRWLVIALFLAIALAPAVSRLNRSGVPRLLAIGLVFLAMILFFAGLGLLVIPPLVNQATSLVEFVGDQSRQPGGLTQSLEDLANQYGAGGYVETLREQAMALPGRLSVATGPLLAVTRGLVGSLTALVGILLLTFFLLMDSDRFVRAALDLFHPAQRPRLQRMLGDAAQAVHGYVGGNLLISLIAGTAAFAVLSLLGMPYAVALGLVIALFDLIPLVGSLIGAAIVVLVALFVDPVKAGVLAVFFLLYQQVENNVLQPVVYGRSVKLHPLVIFLAVLAGGNLLGILGALIAIPVAEILRIVLAEWLASRAQETGGIPHAPTENLPIDQVADEATGPVPA